MAEKREGCKTKKNQEGGVRLLIQTFSEALSTPQGKIVDEKKWIIMKTYTARTHILQNISIYQSKGENDKKIK